MSDSDEQDIPGVAEETAKGTLASVALSAEEQVARGLETLFEVTGTGDGTEPIPGSATSLYPPGPKELPELSLLAKELEAMAMNQSSALGKSRGLLVASHLFAKSGDDRRSFDCALAAAETSPKMALAAVSLSKRAKRLGNHEAAPQALRASARHAAQTSSRAHAIRLLAETLTLEGKADEVGEVLDQAARSGDADNALLLQRIVHRMARGRSLAGIELPDRLQGAVATAGDVLGGTARASASAATTPAELRPLFAARQLRANNPNEVRAWLGSMDLPEPALQELLAALLAAEPQLRASALGVLDRLCAVAPSSRVLRKLARLALESGDRTALLKVLDRADPGGGTFSLEERWFLCARAGQELAMGRDDLLSVFETNEAFALALGPLEMSAPAPESASVSALLAQIGANLSRLRDTKFPGPVLDLGLEALSELAERGAESELRAALELLVATAGKNEPLFGSSLLDLSLEPPHAGGAVIAGALLQKAENVRLAEEAYRRALSGNARVAQSARQGLAQLGVADADELLQLWADGTEDPRLLFARRLLGAVRSTTEDVDPGSRGGRASRVLGVIQELLDPTFAQSIGLRDGAGLSASTLLFAVATAADQQGDSAEAERALSAIAETKTPLGRLIRLGQAWNGQKSLTPGDFSSTADDPAERAIAYLQEARLPLVASTEDSADPGSKQVAAASEVLLRLAQGIVTGEMDDAAELGSLCAEVDRAAGEIGIDTQKLSGNTSTISPLWLERAKGASDPAARRFAYERLAELDEQRGDRAAALLWQKALAEEFSDYVPALLRLEETLLAQGLSTSSVTDKLAQALPDDDAQTYRLIFGARALAECDLRAARKHLEPLLEVESPPLLAIRGISTLALDKRDDGLLLRSYEKLANLSGTDLDRCSRALARALVLARLGRASEALEWTRKAIDAKPGSFLAHQLLNHLHTPDDPLEHAEQLEAFGHASAVHQHRSEIFFAAGQLFDAAEDPERAADCYELTLEAAPEHQEAFTLLCARRETHGALNEVEKLIEARLSLIQVGGAEHLQLELKLASLLSALERPADAKKHLEAALASHPTHAGALRAHADVSAELGAHEAAERSLAALHARLDPGEERTEVMRSLAHLYDQHLGQLEKAMDAYQAVLTERPEDERTQQDLVRIYSNLGLAERATMMQTKLIQAATTPEKKRDGALKLAEIYEKVADDPKRAGATLERTRKAWPLDASVLEATVRFMDRQGTGGPRGFLLDRAGKDARRKLETGRLDAGLLDTLGRVARLSGRSAQAEMTEAARHAYLGTSPESPIRGAGLGALDPKIDEMISPTGLGAPLRALLRKTGAAMDAAFSVDLANMGARSLTAGPTFDRMQQIAAALNSEAPHLFISDRLGAKCLPVTTEPARLLIGKDLESMPEAERDYLLLRALKLRWLGAGALARSRDEDRYPMLAALLHLFAPNWRPPQVDPRKTAQARALIEQGLARVGYDDDVPMLALEVIGALGNQGANVGDKPRVLASRVALLGMGDPAITISSMARADGVKLASGGPSRFRWIESHHEAKDLLLFSTTEKCARAREALGLALTTEQITSGSAPNVSRGPAPPRRPAPSGTDDRPAPPRRPKPPPPKRS